MYSVAVKKNEDRSILAFYTFHNMLIEKKLQKCIYIKTQYFHYILNIYGNVEYQY